MIYGIFSSSVRHFDLFHVSILKLYVKKSYTLTNMLPSITFTCLLTLLAGTPQSLALPLNTRNNAPSWQNACPAAVDGLISGIKINILAQQGERNATEALQAIEAKNPVDMTAFAAGKAVLVNDIMFGMTIRRYNQVIALRFME